MSAGLASLTVLLTTAESVGQQEPAGVQFLDERSLALSIDASGSPTEIHPIEILNGGAGPAQLTLTIVGPALPDGASEFPVRVGDEESETTTSETVEVGGIWAPTISVAPGDMTPGTYSAVLVVYSSDGSLDRRDLGVTVAEPEESVDSTSTAAPEATLGNPLPKAIVVELELHPDELPATARIPIDQELAESLRLAPLTNAEGRLATVELGDESESLVLSATQAGAYQGRLAREPVADEKDPVELAALTLNVRDGIGKALGVLVVTLIFAFIVEHAATTVLPRLTFRKRLREIDGKADGLRDKHQAWLDGESSVDTWPGPPEPVAPRITRLEADAVPLLIETANDIAVKNFDDLPDVESRVKRWGAAGDEFTKIVGYVGAYSELLGLRQDLVTQWNGFLSQLEAVERGIVEASGFRQEVNGLLTGGPLLSSVALDAAKSAAQAGVKKVVRARRLERVLRRVGALVRTANLPEEREKVAELRVQLASLNEEELGDIGPLETAAGAVYKSAIEKLIPPPATARNRGGSISYLERPEGETITIDSPSAMESSLLVVLEEPRSQAAEPESPPLEPIVESVAHLGRTRYYWTLLFGFLATLATVIVALSTQYWPKPAFGSMADYWALVAFALATFTAAQLVKHSNTIVNVLRPGGR